MNLGPNLVSVSSYGYKKTFFS